MLRRSTILFCTAMSALAIALSFNIIISPVVTPGGHIHPTGHSIMNQLSSSNWGGYVVASNQLALDNPGTSSDEALAQPSVTSAYGSWAQQSVTGSGSTYSSQWVGIGGYFSGDSSLIQTGTSADTSSGGASYSAWYELLPNSEVAISSVAIHPGDMISASIVCIASCSSTTQTWSIMLSDITDGQSFSTTVSYSSKLLSAEWIEERPELCHVVVCKLTTLANFTTAYYGYDYSNIIGTESAAINGVDQAFASVPYESVTMDAGSSIYAVPSTPSSDSTSFTMVYQNSATSTTTLASSSTSTTSLSTTSTTSMSSSSTSSASTSSVSTTTICASGRTNPNGKCLP